MDFAVRRTFAEFERAYSAACDSESGGNRSVPRVASNHPGIACSGSLRIRHSSSRAVSTPILPPLPIVPHHVVQAPRIRHLPAHPLLPAPVRRTRLLPPLRTVMSPCGSHPAVPLIPRNFIQHLSIVLPQYPQVPSMRVRRAPGPRRAPPLRFRRQPVTGPLPRPFNFRTKSCTSSQLTLSTGPSNPQYRNSDGFSDTRNFDFVSCATTWFKRK